MYWVMAILPFALLLLGFPIFLLLLITSLVILIAFFDVPMTVVHQIIFNSLNKYALLAVPFFVFAGDLMSRGGIRFACCVGSPRWSGIPRQYSNDLPRFCRIFGAISGVTTAGDRGDRHVDLSAYARSRLQRAFCLSADHRRRRARQSHSAVDRHDHLWHRVRYLGDPAFCRRHRPGLLLSGLFGVYIYWHSIRVGITETGRFSFSEFLKATRDGVWALGAIGIIFGGIYSGMFSPTEAAGVASVYAIFVSYFVYREVTLSELFETAARSMYLTGLIFIIVSVAGLYAWLLTISGIAQDTVSLITGLHSERWVICWSSTCSCCLSAVSLIPPRR